MVAFFLDDAVDNIDDFGLKGREAHEDFVDDVVSHELEVCVNILHKVKSRFSEFLELRGQKINEQVDRRETRNVDTFEVDDSLFDNHVCVFLRSIKSFEVRVKFVELPFDFSSSLDIRFLRSTFAVLDSFGSSVEFTLNLVLVRSEEFKNHRPNKLHLLSGVCGHGRSKFSQVLFIGSQLLSDFVYNSWECVFNVSEQDTSQLLDEDITTEGSRGHTRVNRVGTEIHSFFLDSFSNRNLVDNIFLSSVLDTDVTHSEVDLLVENHALGICSSVHDINFSDDTDGSDTLRIDLSCHLETI